MTMYQSIALWLAAHPVVRGALWMLAIGLAGTFYNWVTFKRTPEEWAAYEKANPRKAAVIRISRIIFPHLRKLVPMAVRSFPALAFLAVLLPAEEPARSPR
jgi:small-conductance mechanosensitive channel